MGVNVEVCDKGATKFHTPALCSRMRLVGTGDPAGRECNLTVRVASEISSGSATYSHHPPHLERILESHMRRPPNENAEVSMSLRASRIVASSRSAVGHQFSIGGGMKAIALRLIEHAALDWLLAAIASLYRSALKLIAPVWLASLFALWPYRWQALLAVIVVVGPAVPTLFSSVSRKIRTMQARPGLARPDWEELSVAMEAMLNPMIRHERDYWLQESAAAFPQSSEHATAKRRLAEIRDMNRREFEQRLQSGTVRCRGYPFPYKAGAEEIEFSPDLWGRTISLEFSTGEIRRLSDGRTLASGLRFRAFVQQEG